jgi:hypothetical protein
MGDALNFVESLLVAKRGAADGRHPRDHRLAEDGSPARGRRHRPRVLSVSSFTTRGPEFAPPQPKPTELFWTLHRGGKKIYECRLLAHGAHDYEAQLYRNGTSTRAGGSMGEDSRSPSRSTCAAIS